MERMRWFHEVRFGMFIHWGLYSLLGRGKLPPWLEYWMDLANVLSATPWQARPQFVEGVDRPLPLLYIQNGGETDAKLSLARR